MKLKIPRDLLPEACLGDVVTYFGERYVVRSISGRHDADWNVIPSSRMLHLEPLAEAAKDWEGWALDARIVS